MIETRRFLLRDFEPGDLGAFAAYRDNPRFQERRAGEGEEPSAADLLALFIGWAGEEPRLRYQLAATERSSGLLIGTCGLRMEREDDEVAELGIELAADQWSRHGAAHEITDAMLAFGFGKLGLVAVIGRTTVGNAGAARLAAWGGAMLDEGRGNAEAGSAVTLRLERSDWLHRRDRGAEPRKRPRRPA